MSTGQHPRPSCFIIMPITTPAGLHESYSAEADHFKKVLDYLIIPAVEEAGFAAVPPTFDGSPVIHASIIKQLVDADLVLCDMSTLNPNVFFELGIRTALNKPVVMICDEQVDKVPFDAFATSYHTYKDSLFGWDIEAERERLSQHISAGAASSENEMWKVFGIREIGQGPEASDPEAATPVLLNEILGRLERIEDRTIPTQHRAAAESTDKPSTSHFHLAVQLLSASPELNNSMIVSRYSQSGLVLETVPGVTATHPLALALQELLSPYFSRVLLNSGDHRYIIDPEGVRRVQLTRRGRPTASARAAESGSSPDA